MKEGTPVEEPCKSLRRGLFLKKRDNKSFSSPNSKTSSSDTLASADTDYTEYISTATPEGENERRDRATNTSPTTTGEDAALVNSSPELAHPSLASLEVTDVDSNRPIYPNSGTTHISNEWFEMDMLVMLRTPNVDDPSSAPTGTQRNLDISKHFEGKQRRFEFQYQVQLKKPIDGKELCFSMELDQPLKLNLFQKALVSTCLVFMKKMSPSFRCNLSNTAEGPSSYVSFTVERALDRLATTPPGEEPPTLGSDIPEDATSVKQRKAGKTTVEWKCDGTVYTMALWSHYIDWIQWQVVHIPGVKHFSMSHLLGSDQQPVYMQLYMLDKHQKDRDKEENKEYVVNLKFQRRIEASSSSSQVAPQTKAPKKKKLHLFGR